MSCESEKKECDSGENIMDIDLYICASAALSHPQLDQCHLCGSTEKSLLKACSGCKGVAYCGALCQKSDWAEHKTACKLSTQLRNTKASVPVCKLALPGCGKTAIIRWMGENTTIPSYVDGAERIESKMLLKPEADKPDDAQRAAALADDPDAFDDDEVGGSEEADKLQQLQKMFAKANVTSPQIPISGVPELLDNIVDGDELVIPGGKITFAFTYPLENPAYISVEIDEPRLSRKDMLILLHKLYALIFFDCSGSFACKLHSFHDLFLHSLFHFGSSDENSWAVVADT